MTKSPSVAVAALLALTAGCGSSVGGNTGAPPASCPRFGAGTPSSGTATGSATALLRNVQVQASDCVDEVSFLFAGGTPGWSADYGSGPLIDAASGQPVPVAGAAHLVVRLQPASGADPSHPGGGPAYDGPTDMTPPAPSGVTELRRLGDQASVATWVVGLSARRPFEVVSRPGQLVIRLPAAAPRRPRCDLPGSGLAIGFPPGWYVELSDRWSCRYLDSAPFVVYPSTDAMDWLVTAEVADAAAGEVVARLRHEPGVQVSSTRVAGLPASIVDVTSGGQGLLPAGYQYRMYVVDAGARAVTLTGAAAPPGARSAAARAAVDQIAGLVTPA